MIAFYPSLRAGLLIAGGAPISVLLAAVSPGLWALGPAWSAAMLLLAALDALVADRAREIRLVVPASSELGQAVVIGVEAELSARTPVRRAEASIAVETRLVPSGRGDGGLHRRIGCHGAQQAEPLGSHPEAARGTPLA
ncbi:MAG: hypothetical protein ACT6SC_10080, partial [Blastomonas fulva]